MDAFFFFVVHHCLFLGKGRTAQVCFVIIAAGTRLTRFALRRKERNWRDTNTGCENGIHRSDHCRLPCSGSPDTLAKGTSRNF